MGYGPSPQFRIAARLIQSRQASNNISRWLVSAENNIIALVMRGIVGELSVLLLKTHLCLVVVRPLVVCNFEVLQSRHLLQPGWVKARQRPGWCGRPWSQLNCYFILHIILPKKAHRGNRRPEPLRCRCTACSANLSG